MSFLECSGTLNEYQLLSGCSIVNFKLAEMSLFK